jgi:phenylacetate-CoA ligase
VIIDNPRRREQLAAVATRLPAHVARLSWSKDQIRSERQRALRETLAFAQAKSPWHAKRLDGVDAASFAEADLARLPVMTKTDVMSSWDEVVTDRRLTLAGCNADITAKLEGKTHDYYYLDDYLVIATGGSSGVRGVFPWSWNEFIEIACATFRYQVRDEPPDRLSGRRLLAVIEAGEIVHGSPFLFSVSTDPAAQIQWFPADTPLAALVEALNEARPTQINCFGSVMQELGAEALSGRLKISSHRVTTNSEPLLPETRDAIRKAWGVKINNMWGCVEVGHIGIECDAHEGMHMTDDLIITEFVDDKNPPARGYRRHRSRAGHVTLRPNPASDPLRADGYPRSERQTLLVRRAFSPHQRRERARGRHFRLSRRHSYPPVGLSDTARSGPRYCRVSGSPDHGRRQDRRGRKRAGRHRDASPADRRRARRIRFS